MKNNIYRFNIFKSYPLIHGASTRYFGSIKSNEKINEGNLKSFLDVLHVERKQVVFPSQIHGSNILIVDNQRVEKQDADGLITNKKNIFLGIVTADCLPVIFYDKKIGIIGIAHAGYKGILKGILREIIAGFKKLGSNEKNILVAIAPSIDVCCYDVPYIRVKMFDKVFAGIKTHKIRNGKYFLDLKNVAKQILISEGVLEKNIEVSEICTKDNIKDFFSSRGDTDKMSRFVMIVGRV